MQPPIWAQLFTLLIVIYIAICFGKIASKHGKNPILYGILSVISPINLIILGYWAFSDYESRRIDRLNL